jgi:hypothetical protein
MKWAARALGACLLGIAAAVLVASCASTGGRLIPLADAGPLKGDVESVERAAEEGNGQCSATEAAIAKTEHDYSALPPTLDAGLRNNLHQGIANLRAQALTLCAQLHPVSTTKNSGRATTTTASTTSATTTATTSTTAPPTTVPTTTGPGGGTPAEEGREEGAPGGVEPGAGEQGAGGATPGAGGGSAGGGSGPGSGGPGSGGGGSGGSGSGGSGEAGGGAGAQEGVKP